jgi:hypothetical protein
MMSKYTLQILQNQVRETQKVLVGLMVEMWPLGSRVEFKLTCRQKTLSTGVVVAHDNSGHVAVRLDVAKEWSHKAVRRIYFTELAEAVRS